MSHESLIVPVPGENQKLIIMPAIEAPAHEPSTLIAEPEQTRAVEAVFAAEQRESDKVAGLLALWTGTLVLHDLALDTFSKPAGEFEEEELKKRKCFPPTP
jgi:hypothetical protein